MILFVCQNVCEGEERGEDSSLNGEILLPNFALPFRGNLSINMAKKQRKVNMR